MLYPDKLNLNELPSCNSPTQKRLEVPHSLLNSDLFSDIPGPPNPNEIHPLVSTITVPPFMLHSTIKRNYLACADSITFPPSLYFLQLIFPGILALVPLLTVQIQLTLQNPFQNSVTIRNLFWFICSTNINLPGTRQGHSE